jgi:hypothetical protein
VTGGDRGLERVRPERAAERLGTLERRETSLGPAVGLEGDARLREGPRRPDERLGDGRLGKVGVTALPKRLHSGGGRWWRDRATGEPLGLARSRLPTHHCGVDAFVYFSGAESKSCLWSGEQK